jgi:hypothetical protein
MEQAMKDSFTTALNDLVQNQVEFESGIDELLKFKRQMSLSCDGEDEIRERLSRLISDIAALSEKLSKQPGPDRTGTP